jgi:HEAT repeat protein
MGAKAEGAAKILLKLTDDPDLNVRQRAVLALSEVVTSSSLPVLLDGTEDKRVNIRVAACGVMWKLRGKNREPVRALLACLRDKDPRVRRGASAALGLFHEQADMIVPALVKVLEDKDPGYRGDSVARAAVVSLGKLQQNARQAVPALIRAAKMGDDGLRWEVLRVFGRLQFTTPEIEAVLQSALRDSDMMNRAQAIESLKQLRRIKNCQPSDPVGCS